MAKDRWNQGSVDPGESFHPDFITPLNVRRFSHFAEMQTPVHSTIPATMAEQMDGDQNTSFGGGGRARRKK